MRYFHCFYGMQSSTKYWKTRWTGVRGSELRRFSNDHFESPISWDPHLEEFQDLWCSVMRRLAYRLTQRRLRRKSSRDNASETEVEASYWISRYYIWAVNPNKSNLHSTVSFSEIPPRKEMQEAHCLSEGLRCALGGSWCLDTMWMFEPILKPRLRYTALFWENRISKETAKVALRKIGGSPGANGSSWGAELHTNFGSSRNFGIGSFPKSIQAAKHTLPDMERTWSRVREGDLAVGTQIWGSSCYAFWQTSSNLHVWKDV